MKQKYIVCILGLITILALVLRVYQIGHVPPSPDWDEAALGYNAYSILQTGKDEYGAGFPVVLRSFDDYKPALYAYLVIPFVKFFGLNIVSVRLPSAIFGMITVLLVYFLVKEILGRQITMFDKTIDTRYPGILTSFLLAVSPWHIQFSRIGFEANVGLAFNIASFLFFLKGLKNPKFIILSLFIGALNIYTYQSEKVFTPLMLFMLMLIFRNQLLKLDRKIIAGSILLSLLTAYPMAHFLFTDPNALLRAKGVSIFADQTSFLKPTVEKLAADTSRHDLIGLLLDNRRIEYAKTIISGYISHVNLNWLFINGDTTQRHHAPFMGLMYLFELPFLLTGIYVLVFLRMDRLKKIALLGYMLLVPVPASVTNGVPHAIRTINILGPLQLITALGFLNAFIWIKQNVHLKNYYSAPILLFLLFMFIAVFNFVYYLDQYFVQQNYFDSEDWQYGYAQAVSFIKPIAKNYKQVIVSNEPHLDQSYMFFLFYYRYDPQKYQESGGTGTGGFKENHKGFLNITFRPINWLKKNKKIKNLYVGRPSDIPGTVHVLKTIYFLDGKEAIKIFEV